MRLISAEDLERVLTFPRLIDVLQNAFAARWTVPVRHHHAIGAEEGGATLLLMPAWTHDVPSEGFIGTKVVSVFPGNSDKSIPAVLGAYLLHDGSTGRPLTVIDGSRLTLWRTAAASALAGRYLVRDDAKTMLMVGTGALAPYVVRAHASQHRLEKILVWGRRFGPPQGLAASLRADGFNAAVTEDLEAAVREADLVSCATLSSDPLIHGAWLKAGAHLDLIGAYLPSMREADDEAARRARIFVDTREGVLHEAGDIIQPIQAGVIAESDIQADLAELVRGANVGRRTAEEITLFKSVGTALEDLAAAIFAWKMVEGGVV